MALTDTARTPGTLAGYFENHADAERAVHALKDAGFTSAHLGVAYRDSNSSSSNTSTSSVSNAAHTVGQKTEGAWEKVKSFFSGEGAEPYADERSQGDLATREITTTGEEPSSQPYGSSAQGYGSNEQGYGSDDFHQTLSGLSVPEDRSRYLSDRFGTGDQGAVVTVYAGGRETEAEGILKSFGADLGENATASDYSSETRSTGTAANTTGDLQNIQLLGEVLRVHKDRISRGDVRIRKETITDQQTIQVPVTREELVIERHPVSGSTQASGQIGDTGEIRIPLTEERASAETSTVVREEISVGKRAIEETRDVSGQVRREELVVEDETKTATRDR